MLEPTRAAGLIRGFSRKYPGSQRGQRTSASLGAVRMRGVEEKTGRQGEVISRVEVLRLPAPLTGSRGQAAVTRHLLRFL